MTMYVYDTETMEIVAEITGEDNAECERKAANYYGDSDRFGWAYSLTGLVEVRG